MATASPVQALEVASQAVAGSSQWLKSTATPKEEARNLYAMMARSGDTIESIRDLIAVPPETEALLSLYAKHHPEDARGIEKVLSFRKRVWEEFDRLVRESEKPAPESVSSANWFSVGISTPLSITGANKSNVPLS